MILENVIKLQESYLLLTDISRRKQSAFGFFKSYHISKIKSLVVIRCNNRPQCVLRNGHCFISGPAQDHDSNPVQRQRVESKGNISSLCGEFTRLNFDLLLLPREGVVTFAVLGCCREG